MAQTTSTSSRTVIIEGLRKVRDVEQDGWEATFDKSSGLSKVSMTLREDDTLDELWKRIEVCGFQRPRKVENGGIEFDPLIPAYLIRDYDEIHVVGDDEASTPTTIKISETLMSHSNTHHFVPIEFSIDAHTSQRKLKDNIGLSISFERTPRMPDDNKLHQLPGSLGQFELFSVDAYSERLPNKITDAGGVFFSMWQREAMWINFQSMYQCAVRVFVGRVNAISGRSMEEALDKQDDSHVQDYIVIPDQQWLDGICVAPGIVRQFVAMPLGSGYTVEGQKTSEEKHGGLQIEITPETKTNLRFWSYAKHDFIRLLDWMGSYDGLDENSTPHELGCKVGDVLKSYPTDAVYQKHFRIQDLVVSDVGRMEENSASQKVVLLLAITSPLCKLPQSISLISHLKGDTPSASKSDLQDAYPDAIEYPGTGFSPPFFDCETKEVPKSNEFFGLSNSGFQAGVVTASITVQCPRPSRLYTVPCGLGCMAVDEEQSDEELIDIEESTDSVENAELQTKEIKVMGLAAGGKLIQDIYKDPYAATTWNHAAACVLNVHILDPESCEQVTHVVPRPPPSDLKEYTDAGGQFFVVEEKVNERIEGGDFGHVKSVSQMDQHVGITTEPDFDPSKPKMCTTCEIRLCDCIIRPCDHQFCNVCIKRLEQSGEAESSSQQGRWKCPTCNTPVSHVAGFSAPMNLPGEEPVRTRVPVNVLKIEDGRMRFSSIHNSRI